MANPVNYIPQVDYTSRDYLSIREDLINLIPNYNPAWTSRDPADFGMTMVELFAYMGDLLNFYIDRATNEGFIATASQRDSVLQLASMLGYTPTPTTAALIDLTLTNNSSSSIVVPAGTQVATSAVVSGTSSQIIFETDAEVTVPARVGTVAGTAAASASQGYTVEEELLGASNGAPGQAFQLYNSPVVYGSISVYVNGIEYFYATSLLEKKATDPVFTTTTNAEGNTFVLFGDGIGGRIPPSAGIILATYKVGAGAAGNVPEGSVTEFLTNVVAGLSVVNSTAASGGADEESTDSIRLNAPQALKALDRAVSLRDYAYLALQVPGTHKAVADASTFNSIVLYLAPFGDDGVTVSTAFDNVAADVLAYFMDKTPPNITLTILPPTYAEVDAELTVHVLPQYRQDAVSSSVLGAIRELVSLENSFFADRIPAQYILNAVANISGVDYVTVDLLRRVSNKQEFAVTSWSRTSNVTTLTASGHNFTVGQTIRVSDVNATVNGTHIVTSVTSTGVLFTNTGSNVSATSVTGSALAIVAETIICATNEIPKEGTFTISAVGGIA